jgi:hypothetical protein
LNSLYRIALRRAVGTACIFLALAGCSKPVEIPRDQFDAAAKEEKSYFRIQMADDSHYVVRRFALTDSTLVIEKLHQADERYNRTELPIVVPRADVASIAKYGLDKDRTFWALVGLSATVLAILFVATGFEMPSD